LSQEKESSCKEAEVSPGGSVETPAGNSGGGCAVPVSKQQREAGETPPSVDKEKKSKRYCYL
jgi:hypothetical protein